MEAGGYRGSARTGRGLERCGSGGLEPRGRIADTSGVARLRLLAWVLLLVLGAETAGAASASSGACCPAMAQGDEGPCASLTSFGCCESKTPAATPEPVPVASLPTAVLAPAAPVALRAPAGPPRAPQAAHRALRLTILRL